MIVNVLVVNKIVENLSFVNVLLFLESSILKKIGGNLAVWLLGLWGRGCNVLCMVGNLSWGCFNMDKVVGMGMDWCRIWLLGMWIGYENVGVSIRGRGM